MLKQIVKGIVLAPVRVVQGVVEAINETIEIAEGRDEPKEKAAMERKSEEGRR